MHGLDLMLHGPLVRTFLRYCIPWTLAMLLQSSAAIVDGFFVGRYVGAMSLAALNLVMPMFSLFFGVGVMLASGGAVRAGKYQCHFPEFHPDCLHLKLRYSHSLHLLDCPQKPASV